MTRLICLGLAAVSALLLAACAAAAPTRTAAAENPMWQPQYDYSGAYFYCNRCLTLYLQTLYG